MANFSKNLNYPKRFRRRSSYKHGFVTRMVNLNRKRESKHAKFTSAKRFWLFFFPIELTELTTAWDQFRYDHRYRALMHVHVYSKFFVWNFDGRFACSPEQFAAMSALAFKKRGMTDRMKREMLRRGQATASMKAQNLCLFESFSVGPFLRYFAQGLNSAVNVCFEDLEKSALQDSVVGEQL